MIERSPSTIDGPIKPTSKDEPPTKFAGHIRRALRSNRRADFLAAAKASRAFSAAFRQLDVRTRALAMGSFVGGPVAAGAPNTAFSRAPERVAELIEFENYMAHLVRALDSLAGNIRPTAGSPVVADAGVVKTAASQLGSPANARGNQSSKHVALINEHFSDPAAERALQASTEWIMRMLADADPATGATRRAAFVKAAAAANRLSTWISKLDHLSVTRGVAALQKPLGAHPSEKAWLPSPQPSTAELVEADDRSEQFSRFCDRLPRLARALETLAAHEPPIRRGAPSVPDPLCFAVECLGSIWKKFRPDTPITGSGKRGSFREFARKFLARPPFNFSAATVGTAVRKMPCRHSAALAARGLTREHLARSDLR